MAINNFDFPGVTLTQEFEGSAIPTRGTLGVVCLGPLYKPYIDPDATPKVTFKYDSALVSQEYTISNVPVPTGYELPSSAKLLARDTLWGRVATTVTVSGKVATATAAISASILVGDQVYWTESSVRKFAYVTAINDARTAITLSRAPAAGTTSIVFCVAGDDDYEIDDSDYTMTLSGTTLTVTVSSAIVEGTGADALTLVSANVYPSFKTRSETLTFSSIEDYSDIASALGPICMANPLALGVYMAWATGGGPIYYIGVEGDTADDYSAALGYIENDSDVYSVIPCTDAESVIRACMAMCVNANTDEDSKVRRALWYGIDTPSADVTNEELIDLIVAKRYTQSEHACAVWCDAPQYNGESIGNFALAAAAAGMRKNEEPHRPLSNLSYTVFSDLGTHKFTKTQLKAIGRNGIWIIANNNDGTPINMKQVTTAASPNNINLNEESIVASADSIAIGLSHIGEELTGCSNISTELLQALGLDLEVYMNQFLRNDSGSVYVGPQLLAWDLLSLAQNSVAKDHIDASITCTPPPPFNKFNITMRVL